MASWWKYLIVAVLLLAVPGIPFLLFGEPLENRMEAWLSSRNTFGTVAAGVLFLLTIDVFLPVPSSIVCTLAGSFFGLFWGTFFATLGMTCGALLGFALGRFLGRPAMKWFVDASEMRHSDELVERYGISILLLLRPVPLFAEASTLWLGCSTMRWSHFLLATLPIHLLLALVYALLGKYLGITLGIVLSVVIALSLSIVARRFLK